VAEEVGCALGDLVGYTVRFDDVSSPRTRLKYLTDGTLLQEILGDRLLECYDVVIIDEAHERTLRTDMILGFLKDIQKKRKELSRTGEKGPKSQQAVGPLKIVVMSATLDAKRFSEFYDEQVGQAVSLNQQS
jgi:ATP-dependent RNA helicase DHX33